MINIEVVYATGKFVELIPLSVSEGTSVMEAIEKSGMRRLHPEINTDEGNVGIYSKPCPGDTLVRDGDRVEIYRPLKADPKQARRLRAERQNRKRL